MISSWRLRTSIGLRKFIEAVYPNWDNRCATCYALRFEETARYAAEHGYDRFTSTLFVSPYQNHELMRQICEQMAEKYGVEYLHRDFSPRFREGQDKARELGLYMQNYCGSFLRGGPLSQAQKEEKAGRRAGVRRKSGCFGAIRPKYPAITALQTHERLVYYIMYSRP